MKSSLVHIAAILILALVALAPARAQDAPISGIDWQVEDRFRFFSDAATFAPHVAAADAFAALEGRADEFGRKRIDGEWVGPVLFAERRLAAAALKAGHDGWAGKAWLESDGTFTQITNWPVEEAYVSISWGIFVIPSEEVKRISYPSSRACRERSGSVEVAIKTGKSI